MFLPIAIAIIGTWPLQDQQEEQDTSGIGVDVSELSKGISIPMPWDFVTHTIPVRSECDEQRIFAETGVQRPSCETSSGGFFSHPNALRGFEWRIRLTIWEHWGSDRFVYVDARDNGEIVMSSSELAVEIFDNNATINRQENHRTLTHDQAEILRSRVERADLLHQPGMVEYLDDEGFQHSTDGDRYFIDYIDSKGQKELGRIVAFLCVEDEGLRDLIMLLQADLEQRPGNPPIIKKCVAGKPVFPWDE